MGILIDYQTDQSLLHLELLPLLAFTTYFDINQINTIQQISATVINVSGRQRMLCQQTALLSLQLVCSKHVCDRERLRSSLLEAIELMEKSHQGLIYGDDSMNLPGKPSSVVKAMYFDSPLYLDRQMRCYIAEVRALIEASETELTQDNPHLTYILKAASTELLASLDTVVSQHQKESDTEQLAIYINQATLYDQACSATIVAQSQAQQLEKTLRDLQQTQSQLIQIEKIAGLGQLVAGVAHEINNPVNCIAGNLNHASNYIQDLLALLHLYRKHYPNPNFEILDLIKTIDLDFLLQDMPELMSSMKMGAERICQIVRSLQNFSRLEDTQMKAVNIHEGLDCTLLILKNRLKGMAGHSGIEVVKQYGELPLVECYAGQLNQVFMNILSNAIDALSDCNSKRSPQDIRNHPSQITIRTEVLRSNIVKISIADNGPGITEAVKARLFEPFFTTKPMGKGTGLGLSISYQIVVEKHKGLLWCESKPGKGTEFCIEIPICQSNELSPYRVIKQLEMCTSQA